MAAIINALFGTYPDPEPDTTATNQTVVEGKNVATTERLHTTAIADDVQVKSVISSESQANAVIKNKLDINNLLSQLGTTHAQVDQYSRSRTAAINEQVFTKNSLLVPFKSIVVSSRFKKRLLMFLLEPNVDKRNY